MAQDGTTAGGSSYTIDNVTFPVGRTKQQSIFDAIRSTNIGNTAPDLVAGQFWIDNNTPSTTVWTLYFYDGTDNISFATIDTINNTVNFLDSTFDLINDTTPQLGGNLDLNSNDITGTGNIDITGTGTFSGDLTVDTNTLYVDSTNNRIGIGTTSPDEALHISKGATSSIRLGMQGQDYAYRLRTNVSSSLNGGFLIEDAETGNNLYLVRSESDGYHKFYIDDSEKMTLDSNGNLGIGTSNPASLLEVQGDSTTAKIHIESTSVGASSFDGSGAGLLLTANGMNTTSKFTPAILFGSTDTAFTTTNPKVGAAINAVARQSYGSDDDGGMALVFYTTPTNPGTGQTTSQRLYIDHTGDIYFYDDSNAAKLHWDANEKRLGVGILNAATALQVYGADTNAVDIESNGAIEVSDALNPSRSYTYLSRSLGESMVGGNMRFDESVTTGTHIGYAKGTNARGGSGIIFDNPTSGYGNILFVQNNDTGDDTWDVVERMRIDNSGDLGIGTSNPTEALSVVGKAIVSTNETNATVKQGLYGVKHYTNAEEPFFGVHHYAASTTNSLYLGGGTGSGNAATDVRFLTASNNTTTSGSERMRIDSSGNVGIGTTGGSSKFTILGQVSDSTARFTRLATQYIDIIQTSSFNKIQATGKSFYLSTPDSTNMVFQTDNTERMRIDSSGNVGIGTSSPSEKLDVSGNVTISGSLSKGSGSFKIDHPLPEKTDTHHLVHSFVEAPQADNIYRGKVDLVNGTATVNIDIVAGMSEGTFILLNREIQCFTSNETGWTAVKGSVSDNILTITAQDETCTDTISWLVIGERQDQHIYDTEWTDENGKIIVEPLKPVEEQTIQQ